MAYEVELLAPAGSFESLQAAMQAGCDTVYFGVGNLNMRANSAANFELEDLPKIRQLCSARNVKCFIAINTLLYDHDLRLMRKIIDAAKEYHIDGIFAADLATILYAREIGMEVHISTQLSISNFETVKFWSQFSDRVVLARELNLQMIQHIHESIVRENVRGSSGKLVEIEVFAHGALCIAISGRCSMSLHAYNASANRGACRQNCRKAYRLTDIETGQELVLENKYVMSPKDICTISFLDQILDAGVKVLKIEGRGKSAEYVERVVRCYREAIDAINEGTYTKEKIDRWMTQLNAVYNRGLSDGYYLGKPLGEWSEAYGNKSTNEKFYVGRIQKYYPKAKVAEVVNDAFEIEVGDEFVITGPETGVVRGTFSELRIDDQKRTKAERKNLVTFPLEKRLRKQDKVYVLKKRTSLDPLHVS